MDGATKSAADEAAALPLVLPKGRPLFGAGAADPPPEPPDLFRSRFCIILCVCRSCLAIAIRLATAGSIFQGQSGRECLTRIRFDYDGLGFCFCWIIRRWGLHRQMGFKDLQRNSHVRISIIYIKKKLRKLPKTLPREYLIQKYISKYFRIHKNIFISKNLYI